VLENAIKFGLYGKTGAVTINMHIALQDGMLVIDITNPYDPDGLAHKGTGFGLEGIRRRLYLLYARADLIETKKENELFTTILKIPQTHVQSDTDR
jgi:two-component system, LytTR family, sensor kinase